MILILLKPDISGAAAKCINDEEAIEAYLATQNSNYFNILYDRYSRKVFGKCYSLLKSEAKAEDAAQEIFVKVWKF